MRTMQSQGFNQDAVMTSAQTTANKNTELTKSTTSCNNKCSKPTTS